MKKAFTMVEMLVVVGILGVLVAVLMGTFSGSTESARTAKCESNMRNLALAVQSVAMGESHSYLPFAGSFTKKVYGAKNGETEQARGWLGWNTTDSKGSYISPYDSDLDSREMTLTNGTIWTSLKGNRECFVCPSHARYAKDKRMGDPLWSYAMSAYFHWASKSKPFYHNRHGIAYRSFKRSDRYLLFAELPYAEVSTSAGEVYQAGDTSKSASQQNDPILQYQDCDGGGEEAIGFNHKDGKQQIATVCFLDGHIEKIKAPRNFTSSDAKDLTQWLCHPADDDGDFDVMFNGKEQKYEKVR